MKKLLSIAFIAASLCAAAQTKPVEVDYNGKKYVRVNWLENIGTTTELKAESKKRRDLVNSYKSKGFEFVQLKANPAGVSKGLYLVMVKK